MFYGLLLFLVFTGCQQASQAPAQEENPLAIDAAAEDDHELIDELLFEKASCVRATSAQIATVDMGSTKKTSFLNECGRATAGSPWCQQLVRPNPNSISTFYCTYGSQQKHLLIHPDEKTWKYAYQAVNLMERLEANGVDITEIYNWWRPEPYTPAPPSPPTLTANSGHISFSRVRWSCSASSAGSTLLAFACGKRSARTSNSRSWAGSTHGCSSRPQRVPAWNGALPTAGPARCLLPPAPRRCCC